MKHYVYLFKCSTKFAPYLIHALITRLFDKGEDFSGSVNVVNETLILKTLKKLNLPQNNSYKIMSNYGECWVQLVDSKEETLEIPNKITIGGLISYGKRGKTNKDKRTCPVSNLSKNGIADPKNFVELIKKMGVDPFSMKAFKHDDIVVKNYLVIQNIFDFEVLGEVKDKEALANYLICGIGQRKSYGFGGLTFVSR